MSVATFLTIIPFLYPGIWQVAGKPLIDKTAKIRRGW